MKAIRLVPAAAAFLLLVNCEKANEPINNPTTPTTPYVSTGNPHLDSVINSTPYETLSADEIEALTLMREEEKMARDLYINSYVAWNQNIFDNISGSEQKHTDAIAALLLKYNITDPVVDDAVGVFSNAVIDSIYNLLNQQAMVSKIEGLKMGAFVEEFDINDLRVLSDEVVDNVDISLIFAELERGSRNHLRSFVSNLANQGVTYVPSILSQAEFDAIVNSPHEN